MTKRNDIPFPDDDTLRDQCRASAQIIARDLASSLESTSDSSLDEHYALARMMQTLIACAYDDDYTSSTADAFNKLIDDDFMTDLQLFAPMMPMPISQYIDIDDDY